MHTSDKINEGPRSAGEISVSFPGQYNGRTDRFSQGMAADIWIFFSNGVKQKRNSDF
jgi:hypothetical protein